jgi:hypothetical protein
MTNLVPIPWQPHLYLTPHTLYYLVRASQKVGRNLYLYDAKYREISPAWRSYAQQKTAWLNSVHGDGPPASNPDSGNRYHMRGAAFDLRDVSPEVQHACHSVGLIRDTVENWHWNDPAWASMPIIPTRAGGSPGDAVLINNYEQDEDMDLAIIDGGKRVFAIIWAKGLAIDLTGKDETIAALRNKKDRNGGPLGQEYRWTSADFDRIQRYVLTPTKAA